jgi:hypothetical protein
VVFNFNASKRLTQQITPILSAAPPFKILVETPGLPSFVAKWLTANGTTIFPESAAPICYLSDNSQLFIGDPSHPVAVKVNQTSNSVLVAGNTAVQGKITGPLVQSVGWVTTGWSVDNEKLSLGWEVAGMGKASFVYSNLSVWAVFGDVGEDNVSEMRYDANLVPSFS